MHRFLSNIYILREACNTLFNTHVADEHSDAALIHTVCLGSSDPPEKIFNILTLENEVYTIC